MTQPQPTNLHDAEDAFVRADAKRPIYTYDVPPDLARESGITTLGLTEVTSGEEMNATRRADGDQVRLAFELAKESVRRCDDERLSTADNTSDAFWARQTPGMSRIRQLILAAYGQIHNPTSGEAESFLGSRRVSVG